MLKLYRILRLTGATYIISRIYKKHRRRIEIYLRRRKSTLRIFSLYKLALLAITGSREMKINLLST
ncbi:MAG: hypothetical protein R2744_00745 [Bacteroidales bacterium]